MHGILESSVDAVLIILLRKHGFLCTRSGSRRINATSSVDAEGP